jgi:hypothetical protein
VNSVHSSRLWLFLVAFLAGRATLDWTHAHVAVWQPYAERFLHWVQP